MNAKTYPSPGTARRQRGFGLIELLVSVVIALFLLLGLTSVFVSMKTTFTSQDQLAQLQDSERLALTLLTNTIQSAGYFPDPLINRPVDSLPAVTNATYGNLAAGQSIVGTAGADATTSDTVTSRFVTASGDGLMNCLGQTNASGAKVSYSNTFSVNTNRELLCSLDGGATTTALVSNVVSMKILYGVDTANAGLGSADRYLKASDVEAGSYWPRVHTARVTLTFANPFAAQAGQPATLEWTQVVNLMNAR